MVPYSLLTDPSATQTGDNPLNEHLEQKLSTAFHRYTPLGCLGLYFMAAWK